MQKLIVKLAPDNFDEITALVALYRPGPLQSGMVDNFINRKHGREKVSYPDVHYQHDCLKPILESTYGVILYQEQVMQIAQVMAGYTLGGADLLRRAMGKKKPEEMAKQRAVFEEGARNNGIDPDLAMRIFDLVEKFAGYGFNKSHSAAYALVSYQTLWLKTHYPAAFMAAVLSSDMDNTDKVVTFIEECRAMKLTVEPPDVNRSQYRFTADGDDTVVYGLGAIKGVGEGAIEGIIEARTQGGAFKDLFEFCRRIDLRKANRRVLESLIRAGALDHLGSNRATLMIQLPLALKVAEKHEQDRSAGMMDMFGDPVQEESSPALGVIPDEAEEWDDQLRLQGEKETLGLFLTGHPIDRYVPQIERMLGTRIARLSLDDVKGTRNRRGGKKVRVAGLAMMVVRRNTQRGQMASVLLDDKSGRIEATLFSETFERFRDLVAPDRLLVVEGSLVPDEYRGGLSIRVDEVQPFQAFREACCAGMELGLSESWVRANGLAVVDIIARLRELLEPYKGGACRVGLRYRRLDAEARLTLGPEWSVSVCDELLRELERWLGEGAVELRFRQPEPPAEPQRQSWARSG
jgi:DNA polymerase-3 subunit alpha